MVKWSPAQHQVSAVYRGQTCPWGDAGMDKWGLLDSWGRKTQRKKASDLAAHSQLTPTALG